MSAAPEAPDERSSDLAKLGPARLPALAPGAERLLEILNQNDTDLRKVVRAIEACPSVAARLLRVANSAWSMPFAPIDSLAGACARLGMNVVRTIAVALTVSGPFKLNRCKAFDLVRFWGTALLSADGAEWLALHDCGDEALSPDVARTAGLVHNLGLLWLADRMPEQTSRALIAAAEGPDRAVMAQIRLHCGVGYDEVGGYLATAWRFPPSLVAAMRHRQGASDRGQLWLKRNPVGIAVTMATAIQRGACSLPAALRTADVMASPTDLQEAFEYLLERDAQIRRLAGAMSV